MNIIQDYYNQKILDYSPTNLRAKKILELTGEDLKGKKILDIGCGAGKLGQILKTKGAIVYGCDIAVEAIEIAKQNLDRAFVFDVENDDFSILDKDFDIIVATELIEHLFSPESFLLKIKNNISKNGFLILTTPNFLVWTSRVRVLFGRFEYKKFGLLDESHIHFFSYNSLKNLLRKCGFVTEKENHIFHHRIPEWLGRLRPNLFVFQAILKVRPNL